MTTFLGTSECLRLMERLSEAVYKLCGRREEELKYEIEKAKKNLEWLKERRPDVEAETADVRRKEAKLKGLEEVRARLLLLSESIREYFKGGG
ncbi:MAG: hypothetical protein QXR81_08090 [Candidatus Nezhaarchaeales archaeon]